MRGDAQASLLGTILRWALRAGWPPWVFVLATLYLAPRSSVSIEPALRWLGDLFHRPVAWAASWNGQSESAIQRRGFANMERLHARADTLRAVERRRVLPTSNVLRERSGIFADVLQRDASDETWWIGAGERQGVRVGDYVTHRDQVVGRVEELFPESARVLTVVCEDVRLPVVVGEAPSDEDGEGELQAVVHGRSDPDPWPIAVTHPSRELQDGPTSVRVSRGPASYRDLRTATQPEAEERLARVEGFRLGTLRSRMLLRRSHYVEPERPLRTIHAVIVHADPVQPVRAGLRGWGRALHLATSDTRDSEPGLASLGVTRGRSHGVRQGAPVVCDGRLLGEIATDSPWTARIALLERRSEPFSAILVVSDIDVIAIPELVVLEREGEVLWLSGGDVVRAGTQGELFTAPRAVPGWKGVFLGSCVTGEQGRIALASPRVTKDVVTIAGEE